MRVRFLSLLFHCCVSHARGTRRVRPARDRMLLRLTTASAAYRLLSSPPRLDAPWRRRGLALLPSTKATGDSAGGGAASSLAAAKAALRKEVQAKLKAVPDAVLAEECA